MIDYSEPPYAPEELRALLEELYGEHGMTAFANEVECKNTTVFRWCRPLWNEENRRIPRWTKRFLELVRENRDLKERLIEYELSKEIKK